MAFDGGMLYKIVGEIKDASDCHIDKIYQPSKDELVLLLRKKGFAKRLLITVKPGTARMHFTENRYENPPIPPTFCQLLRKHLSSARLISVEQNGLERVAELVFSATNEMGDRVVFRLICELIGNQSNIILVNESGNIVDSLKHSDVENATRLILPGALYEYPASLGKQSPFSDNVIENISIDSADLSKELLSRIDGFSPLVCREIEYKCKSLSTNGQATYVNLITAFKSVTDKLKGDAMPTILLNDDGSPFDFSYIDIDQYSGKFTKKYYDSLSELLDAFYTARDTDARIKNAAHDIIKTVSNLKSRTEKKLGLRLNELKKCADREKFRIYGELIKANLYNIKQGSTKTHVPNYYDENMALITIPLNPALTPSKNAEKYFKEYKKSYAAEQALTELTEQDRKEIIYFDTVLDSISRSVTLAEIAEIREELQNGGYMKKTAAKRKNNPVVRYKEFTSPDGFRVLVGKNNLQNDYITTKLASKSDMWFHVKNIPGSHVVVFCEGKNLSEETIIFAARLAAKNSNASDSSNVPVDYTPIKFVKKPSGAKPGMVIYTTNKTVYVTPERS